jgi:ankyrin repeat protein
MFFYDEYKKMANLDIILCFICGFLFDIYGMSTGIAYVKKNHGPSPAPLLSLFFYWGVVFYRIFKLRPVGLPLIMAASGFTIFHICCNFLIPLAYGRWFNGRTSLHRAVLAGNKTIVEKLISNGLNVNIKDNRGWTALHLAAIRGYKDIVKLLLKAGADVHAVAEGCSTPLSLASWTGHKTVVEELLVAGANPNNKINDGMSSIESAASQGHLELLDLLLKHSSDFEFTGNSGTELLHLAVEFCQPNVADFLIEKGAKFDINRRGFQNESVLHSILHHGFNEKGRADVAALLIKHGADVNAVNKFGWTPLREALSLKRKLTAQVLKNNGGYK